MGVTRDLQRIVSHYKYVTKKTEIDMTVVAEWAIKKGLYKPPPAKTDVELLTAKLSRAASQQRRKDKKTGQAYKVYHSIAQPSGKGQIVIWVDIDDASRTAIEKAAGQRRTGILNDAVQLSLDLDHWNRVNPEEKPIEVGFGLDEEIEWEKEARKAELPKKKRG